MVNLLRAPRRRARQPRRLTVSKRRTNSLYSARQCDRATVFERGTLNCYVLSVNLYVRHICYAVAARWQRLGALGVANPHTHHCSMLVQFFAISLGR